MLIIPWECKDWPLNLEEHYGNAAPVILEIGYGNGDFLINMAGRDPAKNYLGIEVSWASTQRLLAKTKKHNLQPCIRMMEEDAAFLLHRVLPADCLAGVFINFSDPWPKPRHHNRRIIQTDFLEILSYRMKPGAPLTVATDHAEYADWIEDILESQDFFVNTRPTTRIHEVSGRNPTRYEGKALDAGIPINYFLWRKPADAPRSPQTPAAKVQTMPNILFDGPVTHRKLALTRHVLLTEYHNGESVHIKYMGSYQNPTDSSWVVDTMVQEDDFFQHCAFSFAPRRDGRWMLKLSSMGSPRPTWGVKRALGRLGEWILEREPGLTITGNTTGTSLDPSPRQPLCFPPGAGEPSG